LNDGKAVSGSQRWLQLAVNRCPQVIDSALGESLNLGPSDSIRWLSPLEADAPPFKEYRDKEFLECLNVRLEHRPLEDFWPRGGPQWDGLARTASGRSLLIEAKANIPEFDTTPSAASRRSLTKIERALEETRSFLRVRNGVDWTRCFYQYANRLAHVYLLQELNMVDAALVFVYFEGDTTIPGRKPVSREGWEAASDLALHHLGVRPNSAWMREHVFDVFIEVDRLSQTPW
jgi:hypothetical protein